MISAIRIDAAEEADGVGTDQRFAFGLPAADVPLALLAFNLGVQAGQLIFIFAVRKYLFAMWGIANRSDRNV